MKKAKYIGKYYDKDFVYLEYEYKGRKYEVYENRSKGNEPLSWQHANAQARIDKEIEIQERAKSNQAKTETVEESLDYFFKMIEG